MPLKESHSKYRIRELGKETARGERMAELVRKIRQVGEIEYLESIKYMYETVNELNCKNKKFKSCGGASTFPQLARLLQRGEKSQSLWSKLYEGNTWQMEFKGHLSASIKQTNSRTWSRKYSQVSRC